MILDMGAPFGNSAAQNCRSKAPALSLRTRLVVYGLPCILAMLVYLPSLGGAFVGDDHQLIENNPLVTHPARFPRGFVEPYHGTQARYAVYRPLVVATYALQYALHGASPFWYRMFSLLLHCGVTLLVVALASRLTNGRRVAALCAGVWFAVHPAHHDVVCLATGRPESMASLFCLGAALLLVGRHGVVHWRQGILAATLYLLGLFSKESAGPFPLVATVLVWRLAPRASRRIAVFRVASCLCVALAVYLAFRWEALGSLYRSGGKRYFATADFFTTVWSLLAVGGRYTATMIAPTILSYDYSYDSLPFEHTLLAPWPIFGLLALVASTVGVFSWLRSGGPPVWRFAGSGLFWFVVSMLPASHIFPLMIPMADRLTYLPSAGLALAIGALTWYWLSRSPKVVSAVFVVYVGLMGIRGWQRAQVYRDDLSLWSDVVSTFPRNAIALGNLAGELLERDRTGAGIAALDSAVRVAPWRWDFRLYLCRVLHAVQRHGDERVLLVEGLRWYWPRDRRVADEACRMLHADGFVPVYCLPEHPNP